jgi:hypothetical protein
MHEEYTYPFVNESNCEIANTMNVCGRRYCRRDLHAYEDKIWLPSVIVNDHRFMVVFPAVEGTAFQYPHTSDIRQEELKSSTYFRRVIADQRTIQHHRCLIVAIS